MEIERPHDAASAKQMRIFSVVNARPRDAVWRHWTISTAFIVHAPVDLSVLERAFRATMRKYVEARSVFRDVGGSLRVDTLPTSEFALSGAPTRQHSREEALAAARSDAWRGFESFQEPLVALRVYPVDDGSTLIASQVSHLLADGGSMEILVNDIMLSYFGGGVASPGGGGPLFSDYVDWEERFLASEEGAAQREFWRVRQPPSPTLAALPYDRPPRDDTIETGGLLRIEAGARETERLAATSQALGVTPFATLLAIFLRAISAWSRQDSLSVSIPFSRRHRREFSEMLGDLAVAYPIDSALARAATLNEGVRSVSREMQEMALRQDFPIFTLAPDWRSIGGAPAQGTPGFPQVLFGPLSGLRHDAFGISGMMHKPPGSRVAIAGVEVESVGLETAPCGRDVTMTYVARPHETAFAITYPADRFAASTIASLAGAFKDQLMRL